MQIAEAFGLAGGALVTFSMIPQIIRVFKLKSAREISILFTTLLLLGMVCWLTYGILLRLTQVTLWNSVGMVLAITLMYAKLKYGR